MKEVRLTGGMKEVVVVPVVKREEGERVENYREVTLLQTAYKIYAAVLAERLREEVEGKDLASESSEF